MLHSIKSHITRTRKPARPDVDEKDAFKTVASPELENLLDPTWTRRTCLRQSHHQN